MCKFSVKGAHQELLRTHIVNYKSIAVNKKTNKMDIRSNLFTTKIYLCEIWCVSKTQSGILLTIGIHNPVPGNRNLKRKIQNSKLCRITFVICGN